MQKTRSVIATIALLCVTGLCPDSPDAAVGGADSARGDRRQASMTVSLDETGRILVGPGRFERTVTITRPHPRTGPLRLRWELRSFDQLVASGARVVAGSGQGSVKVAISAPLPEPPGPIGIDLLLHIDAGDHRPEHAERIPFTLYPATPGEPIDTLLATARIALYDPAGRARHALKRLGIEPSDLRDRHALLREPADLIIIGPGGFSRGNEAFGPALKQRAAAGTPVLILDQPTLPGTLTDRLRLWPSFRHGARTELLLATDHPVLRGLSNDRDAGYLVSGRTGRRPYLPPTGGNFRVLAGTRVRRGSAWQEAIDIVEFRIGDGTVLAAQPSLCEPSPADPRSRILLINAIAYLLAGTEPLQRTFLYGAGDEALPRCIADLKPEAPRAPIDLQGVDLLLVPADWRASRARHSADLAPLAHVATFLRGGGTIVLLDPHFLVAEYLGDVVGERVQFAPVTHRRLAAPVVPAGDNRSLLLGITLEDLGMLERPGEREFRLLSHRATDRFEPVLVVPGLAVYRVGRGTLVALSVPQNLDCRSPRVASVLARILTNLGIPLDRQRPPHTQALSGVAGHQNQ